MSDPTTPTPPEHDRLSGALRRTLAAGGEPTAPELDGIFANLQQRVTASRAQTVRRTRPIIENAPASQAAAEPWRSENQSLRAWVIRLWIGTVAALVMCGFVFTYVAMQRGKQPVVTAPETPSDITQPIATPPNSRRKESPPSQKSQPSGERARIVSTPIPVPPPDAVGRPEPSIPPSVPNETAKPLASVSDPAKEVPPAKIESPKVPDAPATVQTEPPHSAVTPESNDTSTAANGMPDDDVIVVINGQPIMGKAILPATDVDFKIKLADTAEIVAFRWSTLEESERRRVKKLYGLEDHAGRTVWGEKLTGVRIRLASGKTLDALPMPDRDFNGQRAFRTANAPLLMIPSAEIKSEEKIVCYECDFYSKREVYDRWLTEKPPGTDDAAAQLELARKSATIGLYTEALDHLKSAEVIDSRTEEPNRDFRLEIIKAHARQQTLARFEKLQRANMTKDYFTAAECLDELDRNFPNSEFKSRWDALRSGIEAGCKTEVRKRIVQTSYTVALDLIQKQLARRVKVDAKGNLIPALPGKQVTTTHGHIFRGTLVPGDAYGFIELKVNEMNLTIPKREIVSIDDVDLSVGVREVPLTFDDLKDYVCDVNRADGLKAQLVITLARTLRGAGVTEKDVREYFDHRLARDAHYEDGHVVSDPVIASIHDAAYGTGSWLHEGAKPLPLMPDNPESNPRPRSSRSVPYAAAKPGENPETSDDPNVWFANQSADTQFAILRAMAAEKVFSAKVVEERCNDCAGTGTLTVPGPGGHPVTYRCPTCRGVRVLFRLTYQ